MIKILNTLLLILLSLTSATDQQLRLRIRTTAPGGGASNFYTGTVRTAASCTSAAVQTAYNAAVDRDIIDIPAGDCDTTNQWGTYVIATKAVMFRGQGTSNTIIGISGGGSGISIRGDNIRVTGIQFDCNYHSNTTNQGPVQVGSTSGDPTWEWSDFRIDHNGFRQCGLSGGDTTGNDAISINGLGYGVIDHNTFSDCNGECIDICQDGTLSVLRPIAPGHYAPDGVVFVEDNTFNANVAHAYENIIDGNSGYRVTFRYNTINFTNGAFYASGLISGHETCATCSGLSTGRGDAGSLVTEIYENTINLGTTGDMGPISTCRAGQCLVYNNHITCSGSNCSSRSGSGMLLSNYRSNHYTLGDGQCGSAANPRGYSSYCHENKDVNNPEGATIGITTLNGTINASTTTVVLTSTAGLNTNGDANGFAIRIGNETICYSGVSGNTLTGVTRGCGASDTNGNPSQVGASHSSGASVDYLKFGLCVEQPNNSYIWGNQLNGVDNAASNVGEVCDTANPSCDGFIGPDYTSLDIKSFAQRPNNWQYKEGSLTYTAYTYPHPLQTSTGPS